MSEVNKERLFKTFEELTRIDSLIYSERKIADTVREKLKALGFSVYEDNSASLTGSDAGNIHAVLSGEGDPVLFMAHMDTVKPGIGKKAILNPDGRITSDGTTILGADDVAGIAEILEAVEEIREEGLSHRDIEVLFTVAEEAYCVGASAFEYERIKADRAYILDRAGEIGSATVTEPTLISFEIEVKGRASHAGFEPEKGINAIVIASKAIATLPVGRKDEDTTLAIGIIEGGVATNVVPESVKIQGEIRSQIHEKAVETLDEVREAFYAQAKAYGGSSELKYDIHLKAYRIPDDSPALTQYRKVIEDKGLTFAPEKSFGGSDCNILRQKGIDGVTIANAMWEIHSVREYTTVDGMSVVTDIIRKLMAI